MIETVRDRGFEWPTFTESELANIISYIYYIKLFDEPGDPERGERWFREKRCAACHSIGEAPGSGSLPLDDYARYIAPIALAQGMWNHGPAMRAQQRARAIPMPVFVERELADIHAFIRESSALRGRQAVFLQPPDPDLGRRLFHSKGCQACHGSAGGGTSFGPDLGTATERLSVSEISGELWNHSFQMAAAMEQRGIAFPQFEGAEMADLIAFLYYLRFYETGGDVRDGELVFVRKRCSNCHASGEQASLGPDLSQSQAILTPLGLATSMWNHAPAMYGLVQLEHEDWPRFEGREMLDLSAYLREMAAPAREGL
jgi:cytochrome c2